MHDTTQRREVSHKKPFPSVDDTPLQWTTQQRRHRAVTKLRRRASSKGTWHLVIPHDVMQSVRSNHEESTILPMPPRDPSRDRAQKHEAANNFGCGDQLRASECRYTEYYLWGRILIAPRLLSTCPMPKLCRGESEDFSFLQVQLIARLLHTRTWALALSRALWAPSRFSFNSPLTSTFSSSSRT